VQADIDPVDAGDEQAEPVKKAQPCCLFAGFRLMPQIKQAGDAENGAWIDVEGCETEDGKAAK